MAFFFDPGLLPPVASVQEEKTFSLGEGLTLAFCVQAGGDITFAIQQLAAEYLERFEKGVRAGGPETAPVRVSFPLAYAAARLVTYQVRPEACPELEFIPMLPEHWFVLAQRNKGVFEQVLAFVAELEVQAGRDPKNASMADEETS